MLGEKMNYVYLNPLAFMIEIVRDPIGIIPSLNVYFYNIFLLIILYFVLFLFLNLKATE